MMTSFDYNYQNPSLFLFLVPISAIVISNPTGNSKFKQETINERNSDSCSQITRTCKSHITYVYVVLNFTLGTIWYFPLTLINHYFMYYTLLQSQETISSQKTWTNKKELK